jgi:hypothetical protein
MTVRKNPSASGGGYAGVPEQAAADVVAWQAERAALLRVAARDAALPIACQLLPEVFREDNPAAVPSYAQELLVEGGVAERQTVSDTCCTSGQRAPSISGRWPRVVRATIWTARPPVRSAPRTRRMPHARTDERDYCRRSNFLPVWLITWLKEDLSCFYTSEHFPSARSCLAAYREVHKHSGML